MFQAGSVPGSYCRAESLRLGAESVMKVCPPLLLGLVLLGLSAQPQGREGSCSIHTGLMLDAISCPHRYQQKTHSGQHKGVYLSKRLGWSSAEKLRCSLWGHSLIPSLWQMHRHISIGKPSSSQKKL